jgi:D-3-phosphoglycerate dehydrogenase
MIIITASVHPLFTETLIEKGISYVLNIGISYKDLLPLLKEATGLVVSTHIKVDANLIDHAPELLWIGRLGSGMEHIDVAYAQKKNIACYSSPEGNCNAVAELALGSLLSLLRNIHISHSEVKQSIWQREKNRGTELSGKTIGIIGFGNTGSAFAKLLSSFCVRVLYYDKYSTPKMEFGATPTTLETIAHEADIISFHLPLTKETEHFADDSFFNSLRKCAIVINTSRGSVVNTSALIEALKSKKISGSILDVLENEDLKSMNENEKQEFETLVQAPNVIITPHIGGYTHEATLKMSSILLEKIGYL